MARIDLHKKLLELGEEYGFKVYFRAPNNIETNRLLTYPCLVYSLDSPKNKKADNLTYFRYPRYNLVFMTKDPETTIPEIIENSIPYTTISRGPYTSEGIDHYAITCYHK